MRMACIVDVSAVMGTTNVAPVRSGGMGAAPFLRPEVSVVAQLQSATDRTPGNGVILSVAVFRAERGIRRLAGTDSRQILRPPAFGMTHHRSSN